MIRLYLEGINLKLVLITCSVVLKGWLQRLFLRWKKANTTERFVEVDKGCNGRFDLHTSLCLIR